MYGMCKAAIPPSSQSGTATQKYLCAECFCMQFVPVPIGHPQLPHLTIPGRQVLADTRMWTEMPDITVVVLEEEWGPLDKTCL